MIEEKTPENKSLQSLFEKTQQQSLEWCTKPIKARKQNLRKLLKWIDNNDHRIKEAIYKDFKKPAAEVDITEIHPVISELRHTLKNLDNWARPKKIDAPLFLLGTTSHIQYEPKGTCLIIAPWNYPFNLAIGPLVSCLAAGNTAIIKPSEMTPYTSELIAKMISEIFPDNHVKVVTGGVEISKELLSMPFDHIFFTGSPTVGKIVMKAAAQNLTSVTLELGGKSPTVVDRNSNIKDAAEKIAWGKFLNNGQTCIAPDYILVDESIANSFVDELRKQVIKIYEGNNGFATSESYGRIVNEKHHKRLTELIQDALENGAELLLGEDVETDDNYIPPTILSKVSMDSKVMEEEIFGPVLPILTFHQLESAIDIINSRPKPLALYYFGSNTKNRKKILARTSAGNVVINDCLIHFSHPNLPFGGVNNSGIGKSHGLHGFLAFSNEKGVLKQRIGYTSTKLIFPPYTASKKKLISFLKKYL